MSGRGIVAHLVVGVLIAGVVGAQGDPDDHWAFRPVRDVAPPAVSGAATPLDAFILDRLAASGIAPSRRTDRRTLLRRVTFDLTGLPPTPAEVDAFLADDSPEAFARIVDRLLASPRYGERWARLWLDVARYADTKGNVYGSVERRFIHSDTYRDWVIGAFNDDLPYDEFLMLQLAADRMPRSDDGRALAAMGFLTVGERFLQNPHDIIDDRIDVVTRGMMALTVTCARCHEHKFDPVPTEDYYSLYGVFEGSALRRAALGPGPGGSEADARFFDELEKRERKFRDEFDRRRDEVLKHLRARVGDYLSAVLDVKKLRTEEFVVFADSDDVNPTVVRQWTRYLEQARGDEALAPIFDPWHAFASMGPSKLEENAPAWIAANEERLNPLVAALFRDRPPRSMAAVALRYGDLLSSVSRDWEEACRKAAAAGRSKPTALADAAAEALRQVLWGRHAPIDVFDGDLEEVEWFFRETVREQLRALLAEVDRWIIRAPHAPPYALYLADRPRQHDPRVFRRGNPADRGRPVPRRAPAVLGGDRRPFVEGSGRLELARAIAHPENPLTARVWVNRVWKHHFGAGLVTTPSDFGLRSEPPSHPELLDWLARRFVEDGWSTKDLHRTIVLSATYAQVSADRAEARGIDPDNRLLWRANRRRLDFETMRDAMLAVSGRLDLRMGGRPVALWKHRRTIYGVVRRLDLPGVFRVFDFPDPHAHCPERHPTTVPQQALYLMNDHDVVASARSLARRPEIVEPRETTMRIHALYRRLFGRTATDDEVGIGLRFLSRPTEEGYVPEPAVWQYGSGLYDAKAERVTDFRELPRFTGSAWQERRSDDPDVVALELNRGGGIIDGGTGRLVVRRWTAPFDGRVRVKAAVARHKEHGKGMIAGIVSSRSGELVRTEKWIPDPPQVSKIGEEAELVVERLDVRKGETLDFVVAAPPTLPPAWFICNPVVTMGGAEWEASAGFDGPPPAPLSVWERYVHTLLICNEFMFVD